MWLETFLTGVMVSAGLIIAIGSQNAFVLKTALKGQHIFWVCLICFACDVLLMTLGVMGVGSVFANNATLTKLLGVGGAAFLGWYGFNSFKNALTSNSTLVSDDNAKPASLKTTVLATFAITLLNPHVYLDTVVLVGGIGATLASDSKLSFLAGVLLVSFAWFFGLGYGAKYLLPIFKNPKAWRVLEFAIGVMMWWIAFKLLSFVFGGV
ncbi:amino acid transporter [Moraxella caviae]|uniref:Amino acid transporter n=1 Tax=Moraxella caviae TaxID=34060 RepID=A0A1T0A832_9GAMM|nr:LysE/ArgO family amino acid transporter [Moraxella caviae]OOR91905.1 amino acid transporter [Moraxella caviae]STZ09759.1 Arginine exporter protein ArgO [Moraxella caviae]